MSTSISRARFPTINLTGLCRQIAALRGEIENHAASHTLYTKAVQDRIEAFPPRITPLRTKVKSISLPIEPAASLDDDKMRRTRDRRRSRGRVHPSGYLLKHCHSTSTAGFACIQVRRVLFAAGRAFAISSQSSKLRLRPQVFPLAESSRVLWPGRDRLLLARLRPSRPSTTPARPSGLRTRHCLQARAVLRKAS